MIAVGTAPDDWGLYRDISLEQGGFVRFTVGLHPCSVDAGWEAAVGQMEAFWTRGQVAKVRLQRPTSVSEVNFCNLTPCPQHRRMWPRPVPSAQGRGGAERVLAWQRGAFEAQLGLAKSSAARWWCTRAGHLPSARQ